MAPLTLAARTAFFALPAVSAVAVPDVEISPGVKMPMIVSRLFLCSDYTCDTLCHLDLCFSRTLDDTGILLYLAFSDF